MRFQGASVWKKVWMNVYTVSSCDLNVHGRWGGVDNSQKKGLKSYMQCSVYKSHQEVHWEWSIKEKNYR